MSAVLVVGLIFLLALGVGLPLLLVHVHRKAQERRAELAAAAARLGWRYGGTDRRYLRDRFHLGHPGSEPGQPSGESITGAHRGMPFVAFHARLHQQTSDDTHHHTDYVVVALPLPAPGPVMLLTRRRLGHKVVRFFGGRQLAVGDPVFDEAYYVDSEVPEFALRLLTPRLRQWLVGHPHAREVSLRWGPTDLVLWWPGRFDLDGVRWLADHGCQLMCLADPS